MPALLEPRPVREDQERRSWSLWKCAALMLLAGVLIFAHGCHGDEDNELFARLLEWMR